MDRYNTERRKKAEQWADEIILKMTLEEKLHQMASSFPNGNQRLGIPHMQQGECLHGAVTSKATSFPQALALGCTWDTDLIEEISTVIAKECRASGIHQCYGPMLGVVRDPRWGRIQEAYGEDPYHVSRIGLAFTLGLQGTGKSYLDKDHIAATAKHFVADGEPMGGLNGAAMEISERSLREVHLPPFEAQVKEANVSSVMPAHHSLNGVPCHANREIIQDILRDEYGFSGMVVSDNGDIRKLHAALYVSDGPESSALMALNAGVDTELAWMVPWNENRLYGPVLLKAVQEGRIKEELIDKSVKRVLTKKYELGLLDDPTADPSQESLEAVYSSSSGSDHVSMAGKALYFGKPRNDHKEVLYDESHDALALKAAQKAIILLKNENNTLPLNRDSINTCAVIGPNADRILLGNYSTDKPRHYVSVLDGIRNYAKGHFVVTFNEACDPDEYAAKDIKGAVKAAKDADVTILVLGGNEMTCMENQDVDNLDLKGDQCALLQAVQKVSKKLILILLDGRPSSITWADKNVQSILLGFYLGQETGTAVAQTVFGDNVPGGKLSVTVPMNAGRIQCHYNTYWPGRTPDYYKTTVEPLYPFGYGLSYTSFDISQPHVESGRLSVKSDVKVSITVKNTGSMRGDEVVQLYIRDCIASLVRPQLELKRFKRITLAPGEETSVEFVLNPRDFAFWKDHKWVTEPGKFILMAGSSSKDHKETEIILE